MHQPRPYGLHVEGGELTGNDTAFIDNTAKRLTNYIQLSGVSSLKWQYDLPDGGAVLIQDMGGTFRVLAQKPEIKTVNEPTPKKPYRIPMLFSGLITTTPTDANTPTGLRLTEQCRKRLAGYKEEKEEAYPQTDVSLHRFTIAGSQTTSAKFVSQYESEYPTWFSGAMAEFVQVVAGYGRQDFDNLPDNALEQAQMNIPAEIYSKIVDELAVKGISITDTLTHQTGRIYYAYNFYETNAIGFASDNRPWLLNIASNGVWAMPLPMIPETTTQAFKDYIVSVGDTEILAILDRFGGMPSGAGFPQGDDFQTLVKAGVIIRVCDTANYSKNNPYSPYLGWSVNTKASEGFVTCYYYDDATWMAVGNTYRMQLNLAPINQIQMPTDDPYLNQVKAYVSKLLSKLTEDTLQNKAIKLKLARADYNLLKDRALRPSEEEIEIDFFRNYQALPIANHAGNVSLYSSGFLYNYNKGRYAPQIKFPTFWEERGCTSFIFLDQYGGNYNGDAPDCDTIMFVYFVGDTAKRVNYFVKWIRKYFYEVKTNIDFEDSKPIRDYRYTLTIHGAINGWFYTTDIDERIYLPIQYRQVDFKLTDRIWNARKVYDIADTTTEERKISTAICIPFFNRNAVIHATTEAEGRDTQTYDTLLASLPSDNIDDVWWNYGPRVDGDGGTYSKIIYMENPPDVPPSENTEDAEYIESLKISAYDMPQTLHNQIPNDAYFKPAWGYIGDSFKCQSTKIVFGKSNYLSLCEYTDQGNKFAVGSTKLIKPSEEIKPFYFIGVINE